MYTGNCLAQQLRDRQNRDREAALIRQRNTVRYDQFLDRRLALLTVGLLAVDPFLIGHSSLLHTDALLATFSLLALAAALNGLREPRRVVWWALSGLFTGLTLLTKKALGELS